MCLDKDNWLCAPVPKRPDPTRDVVETHHDRPPEPTMSPEALEAFLRYVRFMVRHSRDRVRHYLVGSPAEQVQLLRRVVPIVREEKPDAHIVPGWAANPDWGDFILPCLELGAGPPADAIGWHGLGTPQELALDRFGAARDGNAALPGANAPLSELDKARYAAPVILTALGLAITCLWNETLQTQANRGISLLRNTVTADPLPPVQPQAKCCVQCTFCTLLGDVEPMAAPARVSPGTRGLQLWGFRASDGRRPVALWLNRSAIGDPVPHAVVDLILDTPEVADVIGIEVLNGRQRELTATREFDRLSARGLGLDDFPTMVRF